MSEPNPMSDAEQDTATGELVPVTHSRTLDMRQAATDSWTDVVEEVGTLAARISGTDFVPDGLRGNGAAVAAAILHGRELGLPPMTALATTNVIKGRPAMSAEGMRALVMQAGHEIVVSESSSARVVIRGRRASSDQWTTVTWTADDARQAGLKGDNWTKYPRQMLLARASTELCRIAFADVLHGLRSAEEMLDEIDKVTERPDEPTPSTTVQRNRRPKKAPSPVQAPQEPEQPKPHRQRPPIPQRGNAADPQTGEPGRTAGADDPAPPTTSARQGGQQAEGPAGEPNPQGDPVPAGSSATQQQQDEIRRLSEERRNLKTEEDAAAEEHDAQDREQAEEHAAETGNDGQPIQDAEVVTGRESGPKLTAPQRAQILMHFNRLNVGDRDERLWWTNHLLGLEDNTLMSTNDVRQAEAVELLRQLERVRDRDQLDASLNQDELLTEEGDN